MDAKRLPPPVSQATGLVGARDHALFGSLVASQGSCPDPTLQPPPPPLLPPPAPQSPFGDSSNFPDLDDSVATSSEQTLMTIPIVNGSAFANLSLFCTTEPQMGTYVLTVHASPKQGPTGLAFTGAALCLPLLLLT